MKKNVNPSGDAKLQKFAYSSPLVEPAIRSDDRKVNTAYPAYRVVGLMSGTSLDGVDLALIAFHAPAAGSGERWHWRLEAAQTVPLPPDWRQFFGGVVGEQTPDAQTLFQNDVKFGEYLGGLTKIFLAAVGGPPPILVASHGHTLFHQPGSDGKAGGFTVQLGHGGALAAAAGLPVVCDFRAADVALRGQGAPLVPLGDRLLFPEFAVCLNLGGIANISAEGADGRRVAYDVCACNQLLNVLATEAGLAYDDNGQLARAGRPVPALRAALDAPAFFTAPAPKSLGREWVETHGLAVLADFRTESLADRLCTVVAHVAGQLAPAIRGLLEAAPAVSRQVLATGGGAFNGYLMDRLRAELGDAAEVVVPAPEIVNFKEALIFALLGLLRWRGEVNTLASATGARRDSSGGAIYAP